LADGFVTKLNARGSALVYSTFLGGMSMDVATAIAVNSQGIAYVAGYTSSTDFPTFPTASIPNAFNPIHNGLSDGFVTKLNAKGSALVYSTFLGGGGFDTGNSIAVDSAGDAYVTGQTGSGDFPVANALHPAFSGQFDAFVAELNPSGSALIYSTYLGGSSLDSGNGIAVDANGNAYVTGEADSRDFPLTNPFQATKSGNALFKSTNAAASWGVSESGLTASTVRSISFDPTNPALVFAAAENGIFKSTNGGVSWSVLGAKQTSTPVNKVIVDPTNISIIFAATNGGIFKSTDAGEHFTAINGVPSNTFINDLVIDPTTPATVYAATSVSSVYKSTDGGNNWTALNTGLTNANCPALVIDPTAPATLYASLNTSNGTGSGLYKSIDSGNTWTAISNGLNGNTVSSLAIDPTSPSTIYAGVTFSGVYKSTNGGTSWTNSSTGINYGGTSAIAVDPVTPSTVYLCAGGGGVFKTTNGGANWSQVNSGLTNTNVRTLTVDAASNVYAGTSGAGLFKSSNGGGNWTQFNNGLSNFTYTSSLALNPTSPSMIFMGTSDGRIYKSVDGGSNWTVSYETLTRTSFNALVLEQSGTSLLYAGANTSSGWLYDQEAFVSKLNANGSALVYSTYLGGSSNDFGNGIAVDTAGVGTWDPKIRDGEWAESKDFPMILGTDGSGVVTEVGKQVRRLKTGG